MKTFPWDNNIETSEEVIKIGARQCKIVYPSVEDINLFLNKYHYQKTCNGQIIRYGLQYKNELIGIMTFGYPRYKANGQYELLRLCYHPKCFVIGGSKKLFNEFLKDYTPNSVVSYCDKSKFTGDIYISLNMRQISKGNSRKHFWRNSDNKHITMAELLKHGADQLIGTSAGKGTNNEKILLDNGFEIIYDEGQDTYLYLDESQYFGYIYCVTDTTNNKKYIGQHIANKFDENYYGSGSLITKVVKQRKDKLKLELIEWCKQDISEREIYYIQKFDTLIPNGYNLTLRPQNFSFERSLGASERQKAFAKTERGKQFYKENGKRIKDFYTSDLGKLSIQQQQQTRKNNLDKKLNRPEKPTFEQLEQWYLIDNLSIDEIAEKIKRSRSQTRRYLKEAGLKKSVELQQECEHRLSLQKFGVANPFLKEGVREKAKATCLKRYGVENPFQIEKVIDEIKTVRKTHRDEQD